MQTALMNVTVQSSTTIPVSSSTVATTVSSTTEVTTVSSTTEVTTVLSSRVTTTVTAQLSEDLNQTKPDKTTVDTLISSVENQIKLAESDNSSASIVLILVIVLIIIFIVGGVLGVYYRYVYKKKNIWKVVLMNKKSSFQEAQIDQHCSGCV